MHYPIHTHSGNFFDILSPDPDLIHLDDIAHALSFQCRFNGHVLFHYSVAQHSILVARFLMEMHGDKRLALTGLMHDAAECYLPDVAPQTKAVLQGFRQLEDSINEVIAAKFNLIWPSPVEIKIADDTILTEERDQVISDTDKSEWRELPPSIGMRIAPKHMYENKQEFLRLFADLNK